MKKILGLSVAALLVIAMVGGGTWAFFQDTENVAGNALAAGTLDLTIDENGAIPISVTNASPGQTDNPYYVLENIGTIGGTLSLTISNVVNTESNGTTEFENDDDNDILGTADAAGSTTTLTDTGAFAGKNLVGYRAIINRDSTDYTVTITSHDDDTITFTAAVVPTDTAIDDTYSIKVGELDANLLVRIWLDLNADGTFDNTSDILLTDGGTTTSAATFADPGAWVALSALAGDTWATLSTMGASAEDHLYVEWKVSKPLSGNPADVDNSYQGDGVSFDLDLVLTQAS